MRLDIRQNPVLEQYLIDRVREDFSIPHLTFNSTTFEHYVTKGIDYFTVTTILTSPDYDQGYELENAGKIPKTALYRHFHETHIHYSKTISIKKRRH